METLSFSPPNCTDVPRSPIKLSSGWRSNSERYMMRQRYLRSYPLMNNNKNSKEKFAGKVAKRAKKWLKEKKMKYCRLDDDYDDEEIKQTGWSGGEDNKSKHKPGSSYVVASLKLLLVCSG